MMFAPRPSANTIDLGQLNMFHSRETSYRERLKKRNYLSAPSPPPMTYRDLRLVMSDSPQSQIVLLPKSYAKSSSSAALDPSSRSTSRGREHRRNHSQKKPKTSSFNVYRTLYRSDSPGLILSQLNASNEDLILLTNTSTIDHQSSLPSNGFFHPQTLPNLSKQRRTLRQQMENSSSSRLGSSKTQSSYSSSPSLQIQNMKQFRSFSTQRRESTETIEVEIDEDPDEMIMTQTNSVITSTNLPEKHIRKELHVYMPQIVFC